MNIEIDHYQTWQGETKVTLTPCSRCVILTVAEARALRDALTVELEHITRDEEQEP